MFDETLASWQTAEPLRPAEQTAQEYLFSTSYYQERARSQARMWFEDQQSGPIGIEGVNWHRGQSSAEKLDGAGA